MLKRLTNIELLRIFAILFIISFHYVYKSGYVFTSLDSHSLLIESFYFLGELGVNLFVLITGYFSIKGKFSIHKLIKLILEVNFYYILTSIAAKEYLNIVSGGGVTLSIFTSLKNYFLMFFSVTFNRYWFITAYILVYILSPYLNKFINSLNKDNHKQLLIILITIWSIIPTIFGLFNNSTESLLYYNRFIWMIILYIFGAYIRLYQMKMFKKRIYSIILAISSFILMVLGIVVIFQFKNFFLKIGTNQVAYFWPPNSILMLFLSISVFEFFLNLKIKNNKIINLFASTTLGIYMLHDGPLASILWGKIFKTLNCINNKYFLFFILFHTLLIFVIGAFIDLIRQLIEKYTINIFLDSKIFKKFEKKIKKAFYKIYYMI